MGEYRRKLVNEDMNAAFFDHRDEKGQALRRQCSEAAMQDMRAFISAKNDGRVAIYDATNTTAARRRWVFDSLNDLNIKIIFVEVICNDKKLIDDNIRGACVTAVHV